jgi:hypothetical protein
MFEVALKATICGKPQAIVSVANDTETNMAKQDEGFAFMEGISRITGVLNETAQKLDDLAESLEAGGAEHEGVNAGKMAEIMEDALTAEIAAPLVNALGSISAILNEAAAEVCEMTTELFDDCGERKRYIKEHYKLVSFTDFKK